MWRRPIIDVSLDLRSDAGGKDPDQHSPTLRRYHQLLWSKPLPSGELFTLDASEPRRYLQHKTAQGDFVLASDTIMRTFDSHPRARSIIDQLSAAERVAALRETYTIGGMIIFPGNRIDGKQTINQARGTHPRISDRFDLTLECIRLHYLNQPSPLEATFTRYAEFFALFDDFGGYVEFFLLQDAVDADGSVKFWAPFDRFSTPAIPSSLAAYLTYREAMFAFLRGRNSRIRSLALRDLR